MIRVTHLISSLDPGDGGPTTAMMGLTQAQAKAGLHVTVVANWIGQAPPATFATLEQQGIQAVPIGPSWSKLRWHASLYPQLRRHIQQSDVVHIHGLWEEIQHGGAVLGRKYRKPYIIRPCGMLASWSLAQRSWRKTLYTALRLKRDIRHAAFIHYTAELEREDAARFNQHTRPIVVPNGIDLAEFAQLPAKGFLREKFSIPAERPILLFLSRVHHKKGLDLLLEAFARMSRQDAVLVIVGGGEEAYVQELQAKAKQLQVAARVIFAGPLYKEKRVAALVDGDVFVLPSHQENFGIAVVEALAAGTPVVISDQVNIWKEIEAAQVGKATRMESGELAAELDRWLNDKPMREAAAAKAQAFVFREYDWNQIAARWVEEYARLVGR